MGKEKSYFVSVSFDLNLAVFSLVSGFILYV